MAVTYKDYYTTLGVPRTAAADDIRKAHRKLARKNHPDLNPGDKEAEARFKDIQEAYEVLSDPEKRKRYDKLGADWKNGADFRPPPERQASAGPNDYRDFGNDQFGRANDIGDFSDFFGSLFGGRRSGFRGGAGFRMPARDIEAEVTIALEEAHRGTTRSLSLEVDEACPDCKGTGTKDNKPCPTCHGTGVRRTTKTVEVSIPAGVRDGTVLRLRGQGEAGAGGQSGDLLLHTRLSRHPRFRLQRNDDLVTELPVTPWEAVLGARIPVTTLDGKVDLTIPPNTQNERRLRLRGQGLKRRDGSQGDLYVQLKVMVPPDASPKERELFKDLAAVSKFNPR